MSRTVAKRPSATAIPTPISPLEGKGTLKGSHVTSMAENILIAVQFFEVSLVKKYGVPSDMSRICPEYLEPEISDGSVAGDVLLREGPEEPEEDDEKDQEDNNEDDDHEGEGYSE